MRLVDHQRGFRKSCRRPISRLVRLVFKKIVTLDSGICAPNERRRPARAVQGQVTDQLRQTFCTNDHRVTLRSLRS